MTASSACRPKLERPLLVTSEANNSLPERLSQLERGPAGSNRIGCDSAPIPATLAAARLGARGRGRFDIGRDLFAGLAELLVGDVFFEAGDVTVRGLSRSCTPAAPRWRRRTDASKSCGAVKDAGELELIRRAAELTNEAYRRLAAELFPRPREIDLAWRMRELFHELGAEEEAFATIVASGPNGALPHAEPGERIVRGRRPDRSSTPARCSAATGADCTRTFACGRARGQAPPRLRGLPGGHRKPE